MRCKGRTGETDSEILPKRKKITDKALVVPLEENLKTFLPFFQTFFKSGKLLGKFQTFFKTSRFCTNPIIRFDT